MKIVVNSGNYEIINSLIREAKLSGHTIAITKIESTLFEHIKDDDADAYILSSSMDYTPKCIDYIRKNGPFIPVALINVTDNYHVTNPDIIVPFKSNSNTDVFAKIILHNIYTYIRNFEKLKKLTSKSVDIIEFGNCTYDPNTRAIYKDKKKVQLLSPKQAGIFEILAYNFGEVVKKEIILEKVWNESNYFVRRSLDVFVTHLRKILKEHDISMSIDKVTNAGLMLNNIEK